MGLDMSRFPTADDLVSWAKLCPRTIQSGAKHRSGKAGRATPTSRACSARPPPRPARPTPSSANASAVSSNAGQTQSLGRRRPFHPGHRLASAGQPDCPLPGPRLQLPQQPYRHRPENPQSRPATRSSRLYRHPRHRLTQAAHTDPSRRSSAEVRCRVICQGGCLPVSGRAGGSVPRRPVRASAASPCRLPG
ncbi:transposase [Nonomuraea basaltis]|uniref:transposase n=1 Tax=Nonomuraea basaltis TaxID=2495887 RepID=UPI003B845479